MTAPLPPRFDERKRRQLLDELTLRARLWLPEWRPGERMSDPMSAVLDIAARLGAEVTQRLDQVPEKSFRGMLHWLGKRGRTGQAARLPVAFKMLPGSDPILATAPVQLQADAVGTPVIFETERPLRLMPSKLETVIAVRPDENKFYRAFPGLDNIEEPKPAPEEWRLRAPAPIGAKQVQFDPPEGLATDMVLSDDSGDKYRVVAAKEGLVTLSHGIGLVEGRDLSTPTSTAGAAYSGNFHRVSAFSPFDKKERDLQEHALYLGAEDKLNIKTPAAIELVGDIPNARWSYWGKGDGDTESRWLDFVQGIPGAPNVLVKGEGEIESLEIGGQKLRWLRAVPNTANDRVEQKSASGIKFKVNCGTADNEAVKAELKKLAPGQAGSAKPKIEMEAIANTTPVVLDRGFYPFGREPRLFDAFCLSCPEAFAKPNAYARIDIELGDGFAGPLNSVCEVGEKNSSCLVAGVGNDRQTRILHQKHSKDGDSKLRFVQPAQPRDKDGHYVAFIPQKPGATYLRGTAYFSATDGGEVWLWAWDGGLSEFDPERAEKVEWKERGAPRGAGPIIETCLVNDDSGGVHLYALAQSGVLHSRPILNGTWAEVPVRIGETDVLLDRLAPFESTSWNPDATTPGLLLCGITRTGGLIYRNSSGVWKEIAQAVTTPTKPADGADPATVAPYPLALWHNEALHVYVRGLRTQNNGHKQILEAFNIHENWSDGKFASVDGLTIIGDGFSFVQGGIGDPTIVFASSIKSVARIGLWRPFSPLEPHIEDAQPLPLPIEQPPMRLANGLLLPLARGAVAPLTDLMQSKEAAERLVAIALCSDLPAGSDTEKFALEIPSLTLAFATKVDSIGLKFPTRRPPKRDGVAGKIHAISQKPRLCDVVSSDQIEVDDDDPDVKRDALLCITENRSVNAAPFRSLAKVIAATPATSTTKRTAKLNVNFGSSRNTKRYYHVVTDTFENLDFDVRPTITVAGHFKLDSNADNKHWAVVLATGQGEVRTKLDQPPRPEGDNDRLILADAWPDNKLPAAGDAVHLISASSIGEPVSPATPRNPELSWEYWNGANWWQIPDVKDATQHLVRSGEVTFCVPPDLQPSEVVGRKGNWIRARLVGGDYGQETVRLVSPKDDPTAQIVQRDPSSIRAPNVVQIDIGYEICCATAPDRVLTLDNGAYVDQTDINLTPNAEVAVFTPLNVALGIGTLAGLTQTSSAGRCNDCTMGEASMAADAGSAAPNTSDKAIYLGFSEQLQGSSIALLFRVEEVPWTSDLPLVVEAYAGNAFKPIQVKDETRALSETGVLTIDCPEPLQKVSYFGRALYWLRLKPPLGFENDWQPRIRGVHLNSVWANAAETRRNEIVGQSDGSPSQKFVLAHAPVLEDTLELRVREPIGDDEKEELKKAGKHDVAEKIGLWQGPWVRWLSGDLATASPSDRVFDFDASLGVVTFGDGIQGAIPPIGTDNIVAVTYCSGGSAVGNKVTAWSKLNLISPLPGVEQTVTPEGAAGGSDMQDAATALRFASANIGMRERAVTLRDFELQALQFSADVAQAKAFLDATGVRLVVIMRGRTPRPSNAVRRELTRRLRSKASPALRRPGALVVEEPTEVRIDITVVLSVADLAQAGPISETVEATLRTLLDAGSGGLDGRGWPLGTMVTETHVAAALADITTIEEIVDITINRRDGLDGALAATQLAVLPANGLTIEWRQAEMEAA